MEHEPVYTLGEDYTARYVAADASLDQGKMREVAARIIGAYRTLVQDAATQPETKGCVALRHLRAVTERDGDGVPRELFDAAIRYMDTEGPADFGLEFIELTALGEPSPQDLAAVVFVAVDDEVYLVSQLAVADEDEG